MKYNFKETYLTEGFFDDLEDDLDIDYSSEVTNTISNINSEIVFKQIKDIFSKFNIAPEYISYEDDVLTVKENDNDNIEVNTPELLKLFNELCKQYLPALGISTVILNVDIALKFDSLSICDFNNIKFVLTDYMYFRCYNVKIDNLYVCSSINKTDKDTETVVKLMRCHLNNTNITLTDITSITISNCTGLNSYSFIENKNNQLTKVFLKYSGQDTIPNSRNLSGLPDGNYQLKIAYMDENTYNGLNTLENCPVPITAVNIHNYDILQNFSFKGLNNVKTLILIYFPNLNTKDKKMIYIGNYYTDIHKDGFHNNPYIRLSTEQKQYIIDNNGDCEINIE